MKRNRLQTQNLSSKSLTIVTQGTSVKSLLVMKHVCTTMTLTEKHKTERKFPK